MVRVLEMKENMTYSRKLMKLSVAEAQEIISMEVRLESKPGAIIVSGLVDHIKNISLYSKDNGKP